jgi:hypothetical protein
MASEKLKAMVAALPHRARAAVAWHIFKALRAREARMAEGLPPTPQINITPIDSAQSVTAETAQRSSVRIVGTPPEPKS